MSIVSQPLLFNDLGPRRVVADFTGGHLTTDSGALLLRQVDQGLRLTREVASCFTDLRNPDYIEHQLHELLSQRIISLALGYEDLNDHDYLRRDPLLAVAVGKSDPLGLERRKPDQKGLSLAAPSTLNRLELGSEKDTRYHKITYSAEQLEATLLKLNVRSLPKRAEEIVLDLDAMGTLLHGNQEGRNFNAYYDGDCYLPLYVVVGDVVLWAQLRTSDKDAADGVVPALEKIVAAIRKRCKRARIIVRGDSGFGQDELMSWCEKQNPVVYYAVGFGRNSRLLEMIEGTLMNAREARCLSGVATTRRFADLRYRTLKSWSRERRVVAKAEVGEQGDNPRFVVTNLPIGNFAKEPDRERFDARGLYEDFYCARGEMENVLKQQVLDLHADRASTHYLGSNQLRLWLATLAYSLVERIRALGLHGTELARATAGTIRLRLLKVAGQVNISVRRVHVRLCSAFPMQALWRLCQERLRILFPEPK